MFEVLAVFKEVSITCDHKGKQQVFRNDERYQLLFKNTDAFSVHGAKGYETGGLQNISDEEQQKYKSPSFLAWFN